MPNCGFCVCGFCAVHPPLRCALAHPIPAQSDKSRPVPSYDVAPGTSAAPAVRAAAPPPAAPAPAVGAGYGAPIPAPAPAPAPAVPTTGHGTAPPPPPAAPVAGAGGANTSGDATGGGGAGGAGGAAQSRLPLIPWSSLSVPEGAAPSSLGEGSFGVVVPMLLDKTVPVAVKRNGTQCRDTDAIENERVINGRLLVGGGRWALGGGRCAVCAFAGCGMRGVCVCACACVFVHMRACSRVSHYVPRFMRCADVRPHTPQPPTTVHRDIAAAPPQARHPHVRHLCGRPGRRRAPGHGPV